MSALHKNTFGSVDSIRQNCLIGIAVVNDPELVGADNLGSHNAFYVKYQILTSLARHKLMCLSCRDSTIRDVIP